MKHTDKKKDSKEYPTTHYPTIHKQDSKPEIQIENVAKS